METELIGRGFGWLKSLERLILNVFVVVHAWRRWRHWIEWFGRTVFGGIILQLIGLKVCVLVEGVISDFYSSTHGRHSTKRRLY
jgi:hypothetical protein